MPGDASCYRSSVLGHWPSAIPPSCPMFSSALFVRHSPLLIRPPIIACDSPSARPSFLTPTNPPARMSGEPPPSAGGRLFLSPQEVLMRRLCGFTTVALLVLAVPALAADPTGTWKWSVE